MSGRREFFEVTIDFAQLENHARSVDSTLRWASAIELSQLGTEEAISLLWSLTTDSDEYVRDAAKLGLKQCDQILVGKVLAAKWVPEEEKPGATSVNESSIAKYRPWKVRPLDVPSSANEWAVDAAILNIIQTEGPLMGSRILRLYGMASYPDSPKRIPRSRIQSAIKRLEARRLVARAWEMAHKDFEYWTLFAEGTPDVVIREQGMRKLNEIPASEIISRLRVNLGEDFETSSQDTRFKLLQSLYGIKQNELYKVGELLTNEWASILD